MKHWIVPLVAAPTLKNLKGLERNDFVKWCESRGARYQYDDKYYGGKVPAKQKD